MSKQMRIPRGTTRRLRKDAAKQVLQGKGFAIYWNGGKPTETSLKAAMEFRSKRQAA